MNARKLLREFTQPRGNVRAGTMSDAHERAAISHPLPCTVRPKRERRFAVLLDADARCCLPPPNLLFWTKFFLLHYNETNSNQ